MYEEDNEAKATPSTHSNPLTEAAAVAETALSLAPTEVYALQAESGDTPLVLAVPSGKRLVSAKRYFDQYRKAPERRTGTAKFTALASFCEHAKRFASPHSALFASTDPARPAILSVLNYHHAGPEGAEAPPQFGDHRGHYTAPLSEEWRAWYEASAKGMDQAAFAAFIEDRLPDVADPAKAGPNATKLAKTLGVNYATAIDLLGVSRGLSVRVGQRCESAVNVASGETAFVFVQEHTTKDGGPLTVPRAFLVEIPVFEGGAPYQLAVRLRYRLRDGVVTWFLEVYRAAAAFADAFREACDTAAKETGLPLFYGSPEQL